MRGAAPRLGFVAPWPRETGVVAHAPQTWRGIML
jgi:hypothetical protein